jgi:hypothetical protein
MSDESSNAVTPPRGATLSTTPVLWEYSPVNVVTRAGQHSAFGEIPRERDTLGNQTGLHLRHIGDVLDVRVVDHEQDDVGVRRRDLLRRQRGTLTAADKAGCECPGQGGENDATGQMAHASIEVAAGSLTMISSSGCLTSATQGRCLSPFAGRLRRSGRPREEVGHPLRRAS